jgi:hypothetical protein
MELDFQQFRDQYRTTLRRKQFAHGEAPLHLAGDTSRNGNSCTFAESRCNVSQSFSRTAIRHWALSKTIGLGIRIRNFWTTSNTKILVLFFSVIATLITRDTVVVPTPAGRATSVNVGGIFFFFIFKLRSISSGLRLRPRTYGVFSYGQ